MILNNLDISMREDSMEPHLETPKHQEWALEIFSYMRSELLQQLIKVFKLHERVTPDMLL